MPEAKKSSEIGLRRGRVLSNLSPRKQLDFIAEGLPILMKSAEELLSASEDTIKHPRAAAILGGQAVEELAKVLILVDIVRCPSKIRPSRIGVMMGWFYDHLARMIYAECQTWKPTSTEELQKYIDTHRTSHYREGEYGEYILPNWNLYLREATLYADIETFEDGEPVWSAPSSPTLSFGCSDPMVWRVCKALMDMGAFTRDGLEVMSSTWSEIEFKDKQSWSEARELSWQMLERLDEHGLITESATEKKAQILLNDWQVPMYNLEFKKLTVSLETLRDEREAEARSLWQSEYYGD